MNFINYALSFRKRKTHAFCLGAAKTGTTSIAKIYNKVLRTAHEPEVVNTTDLVMDTLSTNLSELQCKKLIAKRDRRLNLELESSHPLGYLSPYLVEMFPKAKFIVTIREPRAWLKSRVNFHLNKSPAQWEKYRHFIWARHHGEFAKEEAFLEQAGLFSLDAYLKQYSEQYNIIFDSIPQERMLLIKTDKINESTDVISDFIGYKGKHVVPVHANSLEDSTGLEDKVPASFIEQKIDQHCGWMVDKYFS